MGQDLSANPLYRNTIQNLESARRVSADGNEFWTARDIHPILGYPVFDKFEPVIQRASDALSANKLDPSHHIARTSNMMGLGKGAQRTATDFFLSRAACYLIAMNGDPSKPEIAGAQAYFVVQTRRNELQEAPTPDELRVELRRRVAEGNKSLSKAAQEAGVERFGLFHDAGIRALYDKGLEELRRYKGIGPKENPLDRAGRSELAANEFRLTQTEDKLVRDKIKGEVAAIKTHENVGREIRQTIKKLGGRMPEDEKVEVPIKDVVKRLKSAGAKRLTPPRV